jgi:hypothetical protein
MNKLPAFATAALLALARRYMEQEPSQVLGHQDDPYLRRWFLEKSRRGSVYVHEMLRSDQDEELHDHPGDNLSIMLEGEMRERTPTGTRILLPGDMVERLATDRHRIEIDAPIVTLFIMGERRREWGFWTNDADGRFVPSQEFFKERGYF